MAKAVVEQLADQVFAQLLLVQPDVITAFGRRATEENAAPNRVVCVPIGAPEILGPDRPGDNRYTNFGRILYRRRFNHEWHCHAIRADGDENDFSQTELLYLDTLRSVRFIAHAGCGFSDERWEEQQEGKDSYERFGSVIIFASTIDVPIYEARSVLVPLTQTPKIETTVKLPDDGSGEIVIINEG